MLGAVQPSYVPALRMKAGELAGLRDLALDVAERVLPRLIVPPPGERDRMIEAQLFSVQNEPNIATALAAHWLNRSVLVDATYLVPEFGQETLGVWLPRMFERAWRSGVAAIPLVASADLTAHTRNAYRSALASGPIRLGIVVPSGDLVGRDALAPLLKEIEAMGLSASDCAIIADFSDTEVSRPEIVAPIIGGALNLLQEIGRWRVIVFQGTNYPDRNPADPGSQCVVQRTEWTAWRQAVGFDPATAEHMVFGDYAADCATISFGASNARAIRHYRYTTPDGWLVQRGAESGTDATVMRDVCIRIVDSGHFAGRYFSSADEYIFKTAQGWAGPGNSTNWRSVNTTHHITRVISDIGGVRGFTLQKGGASSSQFQHDMFGAFEGS